MPSHAVPPRFRQILIHGGKNGNWYKLGFMDKIDRPTYSTDLNDTEWNVIAPLLPQPSEGRPRVWPLREILNVLFYLVQAGGAWRLLPHDFPPWKTVWSLEPKQAD